MGGAPKWPMSAYNASPPVTASTTAPKMKMPCQPFSMKKRAAHIGLNAFSTSGEAITFQMPITASDRNQRVITGPNTLPTFSVPKRCAANTAANTIRVIGTTKCPSPGAATSRPSTAPSTEMAGVMTPSPKNNEAPKMPRMPTT
ncbi:hypothetical protein D3C81_1135630 [compost metagenome]